VTLEALAPYRISPSRPDEDPKPLAYLTDADDQRIGGFDIALEISLFTKRMREEQIEPYRLSSTSSRNLYWTVAQLLAHHSSNGCNLRPGDLLGTGTISGESKAALGSLLELTEGKNTFELPTGEKRTFLEDGDEVIFRGWCEAPSKARIGFGECRGRVQN
jgi:fumarylacetoacetase